MLRLSQEDRTYVVPFEIGGEKTDFTLRPISVTAKRELLMDIDELPKTMESFSKLIEIVSRHIVSIEGCNGKPPAEILGQLEYVDDLVMITNELIRYATITRKEREGLELSPERPSAASAANRAEMPASDETESPENEPASTIQKTTEAS